MIAAMAFIVDHTRVMLASLALLVASLAIMVAALALMVASWQAVDWERPNVETF